MKVCILNEFSANFYMLPSSILPTINKIYRRRVIIVRFVLEHTESVRYELFLACIYRQVLCRAR